MSGNLDNKLLCIASIIYPLILLATGYNTIVYAVGLTVIVVLVMRNIRTRVK